MAGASVARPRSAMMRMTSLIIPVRYEAPEAAERFRPLLIPGQTEIVVADSGDRPETSRAFSAIGARIVRGGGSRGRRLDRAARQARSEILFFVHADSRPPESAFAAIHDCLEA